MIYILKGFTIQYGRWPMLFNLWLFLHTRYLYLFLFLFWEYSIYDNCINLFRSLPFKCCIDSNSQIRVIEITSSLWNSNYCRSHQKSHDQCMRVDLPVIKASCDLNSWKNSSWRSRSDQNKLRIKFWKNINQDSEMKNVVKFWTIIKSII